MSKFQVTKKETKYSRCAKNKTKQKIKKQSKHHHQQQKPQTTKQEQLQKQTEQPTNQKTNNSNKTPHCMNVQSRNGNTYRLQLSLQTQKRMFLFNIQSHAIKIVK